jgi:hypothetical protein
MIFGALGTQALGEVRRQAVAPPVPTPGGDSTFAGGSAWDERFNMFRPPKDERVFEDEEGLILAYWYARENRML